MVNLDRLFNLLEKWAMEKEILFTKALERCYAGLDLFSDEPRIEIKKYRTPFYEELWVDGNPLLRVRGVVENGIFVVNHVWIQEE